MKGIALGLFLGILVISIIGNAIAVNDTDTNSSDTRCQNRYWFDDTTKVCGQKQFCGAYMYLGLQTFESKAQCEKALNGTKDNIKKPKNITFIPWQKRNESECPIGCKCVGAVVSCTTANGKTMTIEAGRSGNIITITVDGKEADTNLTIESEADDNNKTKIKAVLSDKTKKEIKIMPDTASETAIAKLGELGFTIELKEVGKGDNTEVVYELKGNKQGKFLGIFKIIASERVQVDAETGEVKKVIKPWWSFLASGI
ncbi:MAG: hypothetical protein Q8N63_05000 [Nanoarchaeota archaeon]|nr:hypothetical protein [Nanoarchaeota archaeon]